MLFSCFKGVLYFIILGVRLYASKNSSPKNNSHKSFAEGYDEFINYCKVRNLRLATIKHYDDCMLVWYKYFHYDNPIKSITEKTVQDFILFCKTNMNEKDVTVNTNLRAIRAVLYYFMKLGYMNEFKISEIRFNKDVISCYSNSEIKILLKKPDIKKASFTEICCWSAINFLLGTGCRISTLINIQIKDIDFENQLITYRHTKNRKGQIIPLSNSLKRVLIEYSQYRQSTSQEDYLFCNSYGGQLKADLLSKKLRDFNRARGVMTTGVHRWRHTNAKLWITGSEDGVPGDLLKLQKLLGHRDLSIIKEYVEIFTEDLQKDFESFNPLDRLSNNNKKIKLK